MALAIADQGINSLASFVVTVIMARALNAHDFGAYSLLFATLMTLTGLINTIVAEPIRILGVHRAPQSAAEYVGSQLLTAAAFGALLALALFATLVAALHVAASTALLVGGALIAAGVFEALRALAASRASWVQLLLGDVILQLTKIGCFALLLSRAALNAGSAFAAIGVSGVIGAVVLRQLGLRSRPPAWPYFWQQVREHVAFGKWMSLETVVYLLSTQFYLYVTALFVDVSAAGALAAATSVVNATNALWMGVTSYSTPTARAILLQRGPHAWRTWLLQTSGWLMAAVALLLLALSIFAAPLLGRVFTPAFAQYAYIVPLLAVASLATVGNSLLSVAFRNINMPQIGFRGKALSAAVTLAIGAPLVKELGVAGAALGLIVTQLCWSVVYLWALRAIRTDWLHRIASIRVAYGFNAG